MMKVAADAGLPLNKEHLREIQDSIARMSEILRRLHNFKEEHYNDELRGLKLFALPDTSTKQNGS
jgi:hypothetical protein